MMNDKFINDGYTILKNAIPKKIIIEIQNIILQSLYKKKNKNTNISKNYKLFSKKVLQFSKSSKSNKTFDFVKPFHYALSSISAKEKILTSKKVIKKINNLIGKDLSYIDELSLTINLPNKGDSKKNYLFKKWHQEVWSGASICDLLLWTPIFQDNTNTNQLEIIKGSHHWGHIPHRDREPLKLPKKYKSIFTNLKIGDLLIFHTLLLHRSVEIPRNKKIYNPRLALPIGIKNFRFLDNNLFSLNKSWRVFSKSEMTMIENRLGNIYLSPFRLLPKD